MLAIVAALTWFNWGLVHAAPRAIGMYIPPLFSRVVGGSLLLFGMFTGLFSAYALHDIAGVIQAFIQAFAGLWFLLATTVGQRGSHEDEQMLRRLFIMIGLLEATILMVAFVDDRHMLATLSLCLVTSGFWVTTNFMSYLDRGR
jgi:hypothetical protein